MADHAYMILWDEVEVLRTENTALHTRNSALEGALGGLATVGARLIPREWLTGENVYFSFRQEALVELNKALAIARALLSTNTGATREATE